MLIESDGNPDGFVIVENGSPWRSPSVCGLPEASSAWGAGALHQERSEHLHFPGMPLARPRSTRWPSWLLLLSTPMSICLVRLPAVHSRDRATTHQGDHSHEEASGDRNADRPDALARL